jgi:luciferase-type oxidoreductase
MMDTTAQHNGFIQMFVENHLTLGVFVPIESYHGSMPTMRDHMAVVQQAERLGFAAVWVRDVPLHDPSFGDVGQIYDPWVYLGYLAAHTQTIALATGSIVLPLRHPLHVAKAAASVDQLSSGRLVLGVASGDRAVEFPAFGLNAEQRGERFRESLAFLRQALEEAFPEIDSPLGSMREADLIPKPFAGTIPMLITGSSRQSLEWITTHGDGWVTYPRPLAVQAELVAKWRCLTAEATPGRFKPFAQSLYIDLTESRHTAPTSIHLGFKLGRDPLIDLLSALQTSGVNHVALNLKYGHRPAADVLEELGSDVLPYFPIPSQSIDRVSQK